MTNKELKEKRSNIKKIALIGSTIMIYGIHGILRSLIIELTDPGMYRALPSMLTSVGLFAILVKVFHYATKELRA